MNHRFNRARLSPKMPPVRPMPSRSSSSLSSRLGLIALCLFALLAASGCTAFARAVKEGDQFTTQHQWAQAEAAYQRALAVDPRDSEVLLKLRAMRKQWSAEVLQQAQAVHDQGDLAGATPLLVRALELDSESEPARALLTQTLDARVEVALKALKEERLQDARAELDAVLAVDPEHAAARKGVDSVKVAWARRWFNTAQRLEEEGKLGNALLAYVRADQEKVGATPARERAEAVRRKLQDEVAFLVVAAPRRTRRRRRTWRSGCRRGGCRRCCRRRCPSASSPPRPRRTTRACAWAWRWSG